MQGRSDAATHEEYIERLDEPRRSEIRAVHELIRRTVPQLEPTMEFGMPGYGRFHYRYATGREGDWVRIGLVSNRRSISLYVTAAGPGATSLVEAYRDRLPEASIGKGCIRFRRLDDLDRDVLATLLREAAGRTPPP